MNKNFQLALNKKNNLCPPIWFMRQAGRYHSHYQGLRVQYTFEQLCKQPLLAAEVALGPVLDFGFDTAILFSDILFPLEALGCDLEFTDKGPKLGPKPTTNFTTTQDAIAQLQFQFDALSETRRQLPHDKSLIGFIGGPWTLFTYWMEDTHQGPLLKSKSHLSYYSNWLTNILAPLIEESIRNQLASGAEVVMIFDTSAGELSPTLFQEVVTPWIKKWTNLFPNQIMYYARGVQPAHYQDSLWMQKSNLLGIGVDHRWSLKQAFELFPDKVIQGNFDQSLLFLPTDEFKLHFEKYLDEVLSLPSDFLQRWVCGLGHGVLPKTPESHVRWIIQRVRERFKMKSNLEAKGQEQIYSQN